jgi:N-acetylglucosaminyl-diphospho-decaprenol L-rhamnosyltransferase
MNARKDIGVVLVGINSEPYLAECLKSIFQTDWRGYSYEIVYVDNASSDGSVAMVRSDFPSVKVLVNSHNQGFCKACNQGAAVSDSRYIYLLNNDTVLFRDSVPLLAEFLDRTPTAAAAGNRLLNPDLSDQWSARRFPTWINAVFGRRSFFSKLFPHARPVRDYLYKHEFGKGEPFSVDWVPGSCTLVRREAYQLVHGLPEHMHYWSDAVFCARLMRAGWETFIVPQAKLIHYEGKGTGQKSPATRRWLIRDFHQGAYHFYCEHYQLGPWNPARWLARLGLGTRARFLLLTDWLVTAWPSARSERA